MDELLLTMNHSFVPERKIEKKDHSCNSWKREKRDGTIREIELGGLDLVWVSHDKIDRKSNQMVEKVGP